MNFVNVKNKLFILFEFLSSLFSIDDFKACMADQKGGLVLPIGGGHVEDEDWIRYKLLKVDKSLKSIDLSDLPDEFCDEACKLIDEFRRKTIKEKEEWMLYFDYLTGEIIYCWKGNVGKSGGGFDRRNFEGRHIASLHSHPIGYYSFPSPENFDILEKNFEDFEIIASISAFWIVEFKGSVKKIVRDNFQNALKEDMDDKMTKIKLHYNKLYINKAIEKELGDYLVNDINKKIENIDLILFKIGA